MRAYDTAYVMLVGFNNNGTTVKTNILRSRMEIPEDSSRTITGYLVFVDTRRTPNAPDGEGENWFFFKSGNDRIALVVGNIFGFDYFECQRIVSVRKNAVGDIILGKQYEIYLGQ